jgi:uncharacterized protein YukE
MRLGLDPAEVRALASQFDQGGSEVDGIVTEVRGLLASAWWQGARADEFRRSWAAAERGIRNVATTLREAGAALRREAGDQEKVSSVDTLTPLVLPDPVSRAAGSPTRSTRLDSLETRKAYLAKQKTYLSSNKNRRHFPKAFARADQWQTELEAGQATPEQVAAFESYMATLKVAILQQSIVEDAASHAYSEFVEAAKSGGAAIGNATRFGDESATKFAERVLEGVCNASNDLIGGAVIDQIGDSAHVDEVGAAAILANYRREADIALEQLEASYRQIDVVRGTDPLKLATTQFDVLSSQRDAAVQKAEYANAFDYVTGDGSAVDQVLRTGLGVAGGPMTAKALDGMAIVGNTAQAKYHIESGSAALVVANSGVDSIYRIAGMMQPKPSPLVR